VLTLLATEDWASTRFTFAGEEAKSVTIGRAPHNAVTLPDRSVSSEHALLYWAEGGWWVVDRGSSNGSYLRLSVPRQRSRLFALAPGHRLCAGSCTVQVARFPAGVHSAIGRRPTMEDAHCIVDSLPLCLKPASQQFTGAGLLPGVEGLHQDEGWRASLYGVYDGHSGARAANFLRTRLHQAIASQLRRVAAGPAGQVVSVTPRQARLALEQAFEQVDEELLGRGADGENGSCAAVCLVCPEFLVTAHAGDCRVVLWRGGTAVPLTADHRASAPAERARVEAAGGFVAYNRVLGQLAVSRSFGDRAFKSIDVSGGGASEPNIAQLVTAAPDVTVARWKRGDFLVIACDGVWDVMTDQEASDFVVNAYATSGNNMQLAVEQLVHCVEHERRSTDNITAIAVHLT